MTADTLANFVRIITGFIANKMHALCRKWQIGAHLFASHWIDDTTHDVLRTLVRPIHARKRIAHKNVQTTIAVEISRCSDGGLTPQVSVARLFGTDARKEIVFRSAAPPRRDLDFP